MKKLVTLLVFLSSFVYAGSYRHRDGGGCCPEAIQGPQGIPGESIVGPVGPAGESIVGASGNDGLNGRDGRDASRDDLNNRLAVNVGAEVRWYDWKHVSLNSGYRHDLWHGGNTVDALIVQIKLGRSYEAREMEKMRADLSAAMIALEKNDEKLTNAVNGLAAGTIDDNPPTNATIRGSR